MKRGIAILPVESLYRDRLESTPDLGIPVRTNGHRTFCRHRPLRPPARDYPRIVVPPPGPNARAMIDRDAAWASTSYIKEYPLVVSRGRGAMIEDVDGNRYLDFMAGIAVASTGHAHPKVVAAIQEAASRFLHICGTDFYYEEHGRALRASRATSRRDRAKSACSSRIQGRRRWKAPSSWRETRRDGRRSSRSTARFMAARMAR